MMHEKKIDQYNYYRFLPEELHRDADALISWLADVPYRKPGYCPHCRSPVFHTNGRTPKDHIINYRCSRCKKGFSPLTGTLLARSRHIPLWPVYAAARLSGLSSVELVNLFGLAEQTCLHKDRVIARVMQADWPALHAWWEPHYERTDLAFTAEVAAEAQQLKQWYQDLNIQQEAICPYCSGQNTYRISTRPIFRCRSCDLSFNLLQGTPVARLCYFDSWEVGIEELITGSSIADIKRRMKMSLSAVFLWEKRMMRLLEEMKLYALIKWIIWQRSRDRHRRAMLMHHHGVRISQADLVRSQRKKT
ncbi:hypothetical protein ACGVWS_08715 [Enterobacteriaceae bacterium LUAb1]